MQLSACLASRPLALGYTSLLQLSEHLLFVYTQLHGQAFHNWFGCNTCCFWVTWWVSCGGTFTSGFLVSNSALVTFYHRHTPAHSLKYLLWFQTPHLLSLRGFSFQLHWISSCLCELNVFSPQLFALKERRTHSPASCGSVWLWGWKVSFSHWEHCQFSFHYSTWRPNPHYHNKLYFYRHVQTEEAFQGIRLNYTWPPVFLGNTAHNCPPPLLNSFAYGKRSSLNIILTLYIVIPTLRVICLSESIHWSSYYAVTWRLCLHPSCWYPSELAKKIRVKDFFIRLKAKPAWKYVSCVVW